VKHTTDFQSVKYFLNVTYLALLIKAMDAAEVAAYRDRMWFEANAPHRRCAQTSGTKSSRQVHAKLCEKQASAKFFGTKFGRITSLPALRRGDA
jgi:hypothetical protein